jgi:Gas vesicle synthesis protein GvpL/GvpF
VIELYAIADHPGPPLPDLFPLHVVAEDGLAVLYGPAAEREVTPKALWRHEEVVEALMADRDLLPVRYGTWLEDEGAVARAIRERHHELVEALDRVRGGVELSVRVVSEDPQAADVEPTTGAEYLRDKARRSAEREAAARAVHVPLSEAARMSVQAEPHGPGELLRAAYLVDRAAVADFVLAVGRLERDHPGLRLLCTGPWPPYSFAVQ